MDEQAMIPMNDSAKRLKILASILQQSLARFAKLYNVVIAEGVASIWLDALKDLKPEILQGALLRVEKEFVPTHACPFPVPAHVRNMLAKVSENETQVTAEAAWQKALRWATRSYHPDVAISGVKELEPKLRRALGAAGGPNYIFNCSSEDLHWAKDRFLEAFKQLDQLEEDQFFLTDAEAKDVLKNLMPPDIGKKFIQGKTM